MYALRKRGRKRQRHIRMREGIVDEALQIELDAVALRPRDDDLCVFPVRLCLYPLRKRTQGNPRAA